MINNPESIAGLKVTVMGLGLNGGGVAAARFFAQRKAEVTVTDLRSESVLLPSIKALDGLPIRFVLGKHREEDFTSANLVIKNPGVPSDSLYLKLAKTIDTDLGIFFRLNQRPVIGVTGSKGKSTTSSAIFHVLLPDYPKVCLAGNIARSPLSFFEEMDIDSWNNINEPVVLELSSWQLADLRGNPWFSPAISIITNILPDHQNRYKRMQDYVDDKKVIYENQKSNHYTICNFDDDYGRVFAKETHATPVFFSQNPIPENYKGVWLVENEGIARFKQKEQTILSQELSVRGGHNRLNLLAAGTALLIFGLNPTEIAKRLSEFSGIPDRLEYIRTVNGVEFINDTTATIPEATVAGINSFKKPVHLVTGGADKNLDFSVMRKALHTPNSIHLLAGSGTEKMLNIIRSEGIKYNGPFDSMDRVVESAVEAAKPGSVVLMSPASTSFEMFTNEFERGRQFKSIVNSLKQE